MVNSKIFKWVVQLRIKRKQARNLKEKLKLIDFKYDFENIYFNIKKISINKSAAEFFFQISLIIYYFIIDINVKFYKIYNFREHHFQWTVLQKLLNCRLNGFQNMEIICTNNYK